MRKSETKRKSSMRKPLRDVSNGGGGGGGKLSKSDLKKKETDSAKPENAAVSPGEEDCLDELLLVHSDLSSLTRQIDELVAKAIKLKTTRSNEGRKEIESFAQFLSDMLSSLKLWVPRFQEIISRPSMETGNQLGQSVSDRTASVINDDENFEVGSPEETTMDSLISPSPLVSWRADCNIERGRQLFLLTPLPMSKTISHKRQDYSKSALERFTPATELPSSLFTVSGDTNDDLLEGAAVQQAPIKPLDSVTNEEKSIVEGGVISTPMFSKSDCSVLVMTPCLKMSPPKSCVLLEPIFESCRKGDKVRKSTPFPVGRYSNNSESSSSDRSEDLCLRYPELLGIQRAYITRTEKKDIETFPIWSFSPPKTCVLLEPPNERSPDAVVMDNPMPIGTPFADMSSKEFGARRVCEQIKTTDQEHTTSGLTLVESTPIWKEPESILRTGKRPGEDTLKRELWTKFEAASTYGFRLNASTFQGTAKKGFLSMLDEVSRGGESLFGDA